MTESLSVHSTPSQITRRKHVAVLAMSTYQHTGSCSQMSRHSFTHILAVIAIQGRAERQRSPVLLFMRRNEVSSVLLTATWGILRWEEDEKEIRITRRWRKKEIAGPRVVRIPLLLTSPQKLILNIRALKMEAVYPYETLVSTWKHTRHHNS